jgi:hypothetical protein
MNVEVPTAHTVTAEKIRQEDAVDVAHGNPDDATLANALEIARTQIARHRRKLGSLTQEQEIAIQDLLIRTVNRVSKIARQTQESYTEVR